MKALFALALARWREFYRDKAGMSWNFVFPFFIIIAFYFTFNNSEGEPFHIGIVGENASIEKSFPLHDLRNLKRHNLKEAEALEKVGRHKIDLAVDYSQLPVRYWVNSTSNKGYLLEKILTQGVEPNSLAKINIDRGEIKYVDWVLPGILAMNVLFSCLWGVGWVIVKYRQSGFLKRLKATPIKPFHYLFAQIAARFMISIVVTIIVFTGAVLITGFKMQGSYFNLFVVYILGVSCVMSFGLVVAMRTTSKEFADGLLNILAWPMLMLSEVWFSLEGASPWIIQLAKLFPLTHLVQSSREIMLHNASLLDVQENLYYMLGTSVVLLSVASYFFKWDED